MDAQADLPAQVDTDLEDGAVNRAVGTELKAQRVRAKMSQAQLAAAVGANRNTIQRIEAGERALNMDLLFRAADALGIRPSKLILATETVLDIDETS